MSSNQLHKKARARRSSLQRLDEVGHFDVLLRKQGRPLGLTFKLPEALSKAHTTDMQQALLHGPELLAVAPDGSELLKFGRYKGMAMRDVAENFPSFCKETLQEEKDSMLSPEFGDFAMYLRTTHPEFQDEQFESHEAAATLDTKDAKTLLIVDIVERGVVDEYNRAQAAAGQWDRVILPGMHISSVNGIRRDPLAMATALCAAKVLTVRFLYLRSSEAFDQTELGDALALQVNCKAQRLLEERVSKLVRMEAPQIVDSMRSQAEWEAMASSLASALVKEVYKGDRLLQPQPPPALFEHQTAPMPPGMPMPPGVPAPPMVDAASRPPARTLPAGLPPAFPPKPPGVPSYANSWRGSDDLDELDELSDYSEESV